MMRLLMELALLLAAAGCLYLVAAVVLTTRFAAVPAGTVGEDAPAVTVLKPLCGACPGLYENLASVLQQAYPARLQLLCGVAAPDDPAIAVVEQLRYDHPEQAIDLVIDPTLHGSNRKISNLINMTARIRYGVVVLSDSDIRLRRDDLAGVIAALSEAGVGAVTCLYGGVSAVGAWSDLAALGITAHFLPNAIIGLTLGRARPCFGSLIALRRETLDAIGGFAAFANTLADDYAVGAAVRARGHAVAVPPVVVSHLCDEPTPRALWNHELRWARTVKSLDPLGYAGSLVTHPLAFAVLALLLGGGRPAFVLAIAAIACRILLTTRAARLFALPVPELAMAPARDILSFAVFVASFFGTSVDWKGRNYRLQEDGMFAEKMKRGPEP